MGIEHENNFKGLDDHPAENLDWRQAVNYCKWLTEVQAGKLPGPLKVPKVPKRSWFACLPTEAEWEYACRAGTDTDNHTGDGEAALAEAGWFDEDFDSGSTHPVREKQPNQFGLFDLHGNVWEWCHDAWNEAAYRRHVDGEEDRWPSIRAKDYALRWDEMLNDSRPRVIRGGSWDAPAGNCRSASRLWWVPGARPWCLGFRVCLAPRSGNSQPSRTKRAKAEPGAGDEGGGTPPKSDAPGAAGAGRLAIDLSSARLPRRPKKIK
jgi:formylglycine-generating enzyme required for sulfatase activity